MQRIIKTVLCAVLLAMPLTAIAQGVFSMSPAGTTRSSFYYEVNPGGSVTGSVNVKNLSSEPMNIMIYAADRDEPPGGGSPDSYALKMGGQEMSHVGKWVTISENPVAVAPQSEKEISFTLNVPADAEKGEYKGGLVAQPVIVEKETAAGIGVQVSTRVGVRMIVNIKDMPPAQTAPVVSGEAVEEEEGFSLSNFFTPLNIALGVVLLILLGYAVKLIFFKKEKKSE